MERIWILIFGIFFIGGVFALTATQNLVVNVLPGGIPLNIFSPINGSVYDFRQIPVDLSFGTEVDSFMIVRVDDENKTTMLCKKCTEYFKRKPFDDGLNEIIIMLRSPQGVEVSRLISFIVDTRDPKIKKTLPKKGLTNGTFSVEFQEANPVLLEMNYGLVGNLKNRTVNLETECVEKRPNKVCEFNVDLEGFDMKEIEYVFELTDILGNSDISKKRNVEVDIEKPFISDFDFVIDGNKVNFSFIVLEKNFDEINFLDNSENRPRKKIFCSKLKDNSCYVSRRFDKGEHNLTINVLDKSGNIEKIENVLFEIN